MMAAAKPNIDEELFFVMELSYRKAPTLTYKVLLHLPSVQGFGHRPGFGPHQPLQGR